MKQLQVSVPKKLKNEVEEILEKYSSDISSKEAEKNDEEIAEFTVTAESEDIDDLTEELKNVEGIDSGDLSIRVIKQESLIRKGQETKGSSSMLSQEELYSQAQGSSGFNLAQWSLICVASVIAAYGLIADNVIVVIGAMMVAPILSPFISGALSLTVGDRKLFLSSLRTGVLSIIIAVISAYVAVLPFPVSSNSVLQLVSTPSILAVLLAVFVGAAAALTFATGLRDEIAGVAVAIALIPPISSIGIGLKMADFSLVVDASTVASMNMLAVIISGYLCFNIMGLKPSTYYKKKQAKQIRYLIPVALIFFSLLAAPVAYSSYQNYEDYISEKQIQKDANQFFGDRLLQTDLDGSTAIFYVVGEANVTDFEQKTDNDRNIRVIQLQRIN